MFLKGMAALKMNYFGLFSTHCLTNCIVKKYQYKFSIEYLKREHVKMLKRHSHSTGLIDFYITLTYNLTIG